MGGDSGAAYATYKRRHAHSRYGSIATARRCAVTQTRWPSYASHARVDHEAPELCFGSRCPCICRTCARMRCGGEPVLYHTPTCMCAARSWHNGSGTGLARHRSPRGEGVCVPLCPAGPTAKCSMGCEPDRPPVQYVRRCTTCGRVASAGSSATRPHAGIVPFFGLLCASHRCH